MYISDFFRTISEKCFIFAENSTNLTFLVGLGLGCTSRYVADTIDKTPEYAGKLAESVQKNVTETCLTGAFTIAENVVSSLQKVSAKIASYFCWPFTHDQSSLSSNEVELIDINPKDDRKNSGDLQDDDDVWINV